MKFYKACLGLALVAGLSACGGGSSGGVVTCVEVKSIRPLGDGEECVSGVWEIVLSGGEVGVKSELEIGVKLE